MNLYITDHDRCAKRKILDASRENHFVTSSFRACISFHSNRKRYRVVKSQAVVDKSAKRVSIGLRAENEQHDDLHDLHGGLSCAPMVDGKSSVNTSYFWLQV